MFTEVQILIARMRSELKRLRHDEGGYTTEAVVATALFVTGALIVIGILIAKVTAKANGIDLN
jgi:hypothetical protein